ncbi:MAG TPA: hypothetical protein P5081_17065 [Phycisphaerae bacterium]|nr:hypothetical protein [Phycisphaerae bacterium]HRW54584.1 hypothetical protein [Phycisphaerae bacterium]
MSRLTEADLIWNRACGDDKLRDLPGDRALADLLIAHGLAMNGGVLHAVECMTAEQLSDADSGYRYFGLDGIASLLTRAQRILELGEDLEAREDQLDAEYVELIPTDTELGQRFEARFKTHRSDFAPLRAIDGDGG